MAKPTTPTPTKRIDGELWRFHKTFKTSKEARQETQRLREQGKRTRLLKRTGVKFVGRPRWVVYQKPRGELLPGERKQLARKFLSFR